jgi:histone H3/H4
MMEEPIVRQVREEVFVLLQAGHDRTAIRRAVRLQVTSALGTGELTALRVQQIAHATMQGAVQAAEQADQPIDIAGAEASEGLLDAVRESGGRATQYLKDAVQGGITALEEYGARLKETATEAAEHSRRTLQTLIERFQRLRF